MSEAPTPEKIDELAREYLELCNSADHAKEDLEKKADELTPLVEQFGSAHGKKSKLLVGAEFEMMTTTGTSTSIDGAAVSKIRAALTRVKQIPLFKKLFRIVERYELAPGAEGLVRGKLPKGAPKNLRMLFQDAVLTESKPPRLSDVRPRKKTAAA